MSDFVRESAKFITSKARHVQIDYDAIAKLARHLLEVGDNDSHGVKSWKQRPLYPKVADEKAIAWIFVVDVLNFSFWHPSDDRFMTVINYGGNGYTGFMSLVAAIDRAIDNGISILDPKFYATISETDMQNIFKPDSGDEMPLIPERAKALREAGTVLLEKFDGSFVNCVKQANGSAQALLRIVLDNFPAFRDEVGTYCGRKVAFYKRAQLVIADIWACFEGNGLGSFSDINTLTMFADYRVPQVLTHLGVLTYSDELNRLLAETHVFNYGDPMECEIRGSCIRVVDLLSDKIRELAGDKKFSDGALNSILIDQYLYGHYRRAHAAELSCVPYHRVRCTYY